jgi:hypothetical protein
VLALPVMHSAGRMTLVGIGLLFACGGHGSVIEDDWVEIDLQGTDQTWFMYPDGCSAPSVSQMYLYEDGYAGAEIAVAIDSLAGTRVGVTIPDEPISLWIGEADGCERFAVSLADSEVGLTAVVDLECDLPWIGVWMSLAFTCS